MAIRFASTSLRSALDLRQNISRTVRVLVVAGGGGGGGSGIRPAGGGGAGGLVEATLTVSLGTAYNIVIGAGGAPQSPGTYSRCGPVFAFGGGAGTNGNAYQSGASSGGTHVGAALAVTAGPQGNAGGAGASGSRGGGGGGHSAVGSAGSGTTGGNGGNGTASLLPAAGSTVFCGGGGGGGTASGSGGTGGGGAGSASTGPVNAVAGTANTGGGGGGGATLSTTTAGSGGSGIVVLRFDASLRISIGSGLVSTTTAVGGETVVEITGGTADTVSWS